MAGILLNRSRQVPAEDTPAFGGIAERFRRAGDLDRAIGLCRDGLKKFPDQLSARVTLGWSLLDKGQYEEARAELERVLRRAPDNLAAIRGLAELHDRSEGAMPSMEDHRLDEGAHDEAAPAASVLAASGSPAMAVDPFAPISVTFATGSSATPEIVHTAEDAGRAAEAAASASAAMALLGAERVEVEPPATAAMAASFEMEAAFDGPAGEPVALDLGGADAPGEAIELESPADKLFVADGSPAGDAFAAPAAELAETDDLVAALHQFSVDEAQPAGSDLVLDVSGGDDLSIEASAFDAEPAPGFVSGFTTDEGAFEVSAGTSLDMPAAAFESSPAAMADVGASDGPVVAADAALDLAAAGEPAIAYASALPESTVELDASIAELDLDLSSGADLATAAVAEDGLSDALVDLVAAPAPLAVPADVPAALADVAEVEPPPAFVPDLAFALEPEAGEAAAVPEATAEPASAAHESPLDLTTSEPAFVPDLSGMALDGFGFDAPVSTPMPIEAPAADILSDADRDSADPDFVPDLSAVAFDDHLAAFTTPGTEPASVLAGSSSVVRLRPRPELRALERFLRQVEARKLQIAQGSVA